MCSHPSVGPGTTAPQKDANKRGTPKRKQTFLPLVTLNELTSDEEGFSEGEILRPCLSFALTPGLTAWQNQIYNLISRMVVPSVSGFTGATCRLERVGDLTFQ